MLPLVATRNVGAFVWVHFSMHLVGGPTRWARSVTMSRCEKNLLAHRHGKRRQQIEQRHLSLRPYVVLVVVVLLQSQACRFISLMERIWWSPRDPRSVTIIFAVVAFWRKREFLVSRATSKMTQWILTQWKWRNENDAIELTQSKWRNQNDAMNFDAILTQWILTQWILTQWIEAMKKINHWHRKMTQCMTTRDCQSFHSFLNLEWWQTQPSFVRCSLGRCLFVNHSQHKTTYHENAPTNPFLSFLMIRGVEEKVCACSLPILLFQDFSILCNLQK